METKRIFVSLGVPQNVKHRIEAYLSDLYSEPLARIMPRENWHITVVFCGDLTEEELEELKFNVAEAAKQTKRFKMIPEKITFAPPFKPYMVWLALKHSPEFSNLCKKLWSFSQNQEKINPHVTLVKFDGRHYPNLKHHLSPEGESVIGDIEPFEINSIDIMESHLGKAGSQYELLEKYNLT